MVAQLPHILEVYGFKAHHWILKVVTRTLRVDTNFELTNFPSVYPKNTLGSYQKPRLEEDISACVTNVGTRTTN